MKERGQEEKNKIVLFIFTIFSLIIIAGISWIKCHIIPNVIRNTCIYGVLLAVTLYKYYSDRKKKGLNYSNNDNPLYYSLCIIVSFIIAILCVFISPLIWPLIPLAVALSLFSNAFCGLVAFIYIITIPIMILNANNWVFIIYFIAGLVAIIGFDGWERNFKSVKPFLCIASSLIVTQTVSIWIYSDFNHILFFILPSFINLFINGILIFFILKKFTQVFLTSEEDQYMDINDQSYVLMEKLKNDSLDDYYRCIHTAHFADVFSSNVNADTGAVRTAAYYYRFGVIYSKLGIAGFNMSEYMLLMMDAHHFPEKARKVIEELCNKNLESKESALVYISDYFIKSVSFLIKEKPEVKPDWDRCVDYVFDKCLDENIFERCSITIGELKTCMALLKRDKMYYELLCRK